METEVRVEHPPVVLHTRPAFEMDEEQFFQFCRINRDWRIERTAEGDLEIMPPTGGETSHRNIDILSQLHTWAQSNGIGAAFDSNGGFALPNGAMRSPDASWVRRERLANLTAEQKQRFLPLCPDFVIELRSPTDSLATLQAKMQEYLQTGTRLGWLLDPESKRAYMYRPGREVERLDGPTELSGEAVLPGFVLNLRPIWEPGI